MYLADQRCFNDFFRIFMAVHLLVQTIGIVHGMKHDPVSPGVHNAMMPHPSHHPVYKRQARYPLHIHKATGRLDSSSEMDVPVGLRLPAKMTMGPIDEAEPSRYVPLPQRRGDAWNYIHGPSSPLSDEDILDSHGGKRRTGHQLGNSNRQRNRYDPALKLIGLGKREHKPPKYDPGWKFVGLGKRATERSEPVDLQEPDLFPVYASSQPLGGKTFGARDPKPTDQYNPYLSILALSNLSDFFHELKEELKSPRKSAQSSEDSAESKMAARKDGGDAEGYLSLVSDESSGRHEMRKLRDADALHILESRSEKMLGGSTRKSTRSKYDPGWNLTGLGK